MATESTTITGGGTFAISSGATLGVTSANGITTAGTALGNIQTLLRSYNEGANYIYNGTSAQVTGTGLTQNIPANLTINNSSGVTLSNQTTISGLLTMTSGTLNTANTNLTIGSLTGSSNITNSSGTAGNVVITVGSDNTSPSAFSGVISNGTATSASLVKTGTGALILSGTNTYSGTTTITNGTLELGSGTCIPDNSNVILNGGTLSTGSGTGFSETAGTLNLQSSSSIALGTGTHSLTFSPSSGETWGSGTLTVTGWTGNAGSGGTAGKIFAGSNESGLTTQLSQVAFYGYGSTSGILTTGEVIPLTEPTIVISSPDPAVNAGNILQNTVNNVIYRFDISVTVENAVLSGLQITTAGTYTGSDLANLKAWYSADNIFNSGSDALLSTETSPPGPGTHVFPGWTNQEIASGTTGYVFVTADIPCNAVTANTLSVDAVTTSDVSFIIGSRSGTAYPGGLQTIQDAIPENASGLSASVADSESSLSWTNPGCFTEIMIVGKTGSAVTGPPAGDGSTYSPDLAFGSGTAFEGGYVVYKGSSSPQTVTSLTNGSIHYFTFFTRKGTTWSSGATVSVTPVSDTQLDYRSAASGNWSNPVTWQKSFDGGSSWIPATIPPDYTNDQINILNGHTVTAASAVTVDQVVVELGGKVTVNNVTMTIADGTGDDFVVNGTFELTGTSGVITPTGNLVFNSSGTYIHNRNGGSVPTATWAASANCNITGVTTTAPIIPSATQPLGNFTWDCPSQLGLPNIIDLAGQLTSVNGNFNLVSTGAANNYLNLGREVSSNLTVQGSYNQYNGILGLGPRQNINNRTMTIEGDFNLFLGAVFYISPAERNRFA